MTELVIFVGVAASVVAVLVGLWFWGISWVARERPPLSQQECMGDPEDHKAFKTMGIRR